MNVNTPDELNLINYIQVLRKRKWLILIGTLICMIVATIITLMMPGIYRGEATFRVAGMDTTGQGITAKEMVTLIGSPDREKLRQVLPRNYGFISVLRVNVIRDSADKFQLVIEAERIDDIPVAISEFVGYMENNPLIRRYVEDEKERLNQQREELSKVIESSKELVKTYDTLIKTGRLIPVGFNPVDLIKRISDIKMEKLQVEHTLRKLRGVEMVAPPYISAKPVKPKKRQNVMIAGVVGLLASVIVAFFIEFLEKNRISLKRPV